MIALELLFTPLCTKQSLLLSDSNDTVSALPSNPATNRKMEELPPAGGAATVRLLFIPWCTTTIPGKSNGSSITDLPIASLSVENFGGGESVKMSLKVAPTVELLPGGGRIFIVIEWSEFVELKGKFPDTWEEFADAFARKITFSDSWI